MARTYSQGHVAALHVSLSTPSPLSAGFGLHGRHTAVVACRQSESFESGNRSRVRQVLRVVVLRILAAVFTGWTAGKSSTVAGDHEWDSPEGTQPLGALACERRACLSRDGRTPAAPSPSSGWRPTNGSPSGAAACCGPRMHRGPAAPRPAWARAACHWAPSRLRSSRRPSPPSADPPSPAPPLRAAMSRHACWPSSRVTGHKLRPQSRPAAHRLPALPPRAPTRRTPASPAVCRASRASRRSRPSVRPSVRCCRRPGAASTAGRSCCAIRAGGCACQVGDSFRLRRSLAAASALRRAAHPP